MLEDKNNHELNRAPVLALLPQLAKVKLGVFEDNDYVDKHVTIPHGKTTDDILTKGGVIAAGEAGTAKGEDKGKGEGKVSPNTLRIEDWGKSSNQLVQALRSGAISELPHAQLMDLLHGRELFGWPEALRNWIGDEMMTMLRQDLPGRAFADLRGVAENEGAPGAMRDYAIQHISHLVNDGVAGAEAVAVLRAAQASGDPAVSGTALVSLHRISQQRPELFPRAEVRALAEAAARNGDERAKISAAAILREAER